MRKPIILIVDDDPKIRRMLGELLRDEGYRTLDASTGQDALDTLNRTHVDCVILDLVLPDINGIEVLRKVKAQFPELPVLILSGHGTIARAVEATKLGAFDFLEKTTESSRILIAVRNALMLSRLERERVQLIEQTMRKYQIIGVSPAIKSIFKTIERVGPTDARVLIVGESGTGKELIARAIHLRSPRAGNPFLPVNCAAIPEELAEAELFGYEKGAFTGAVERRMGKFEAASEGTLFLDEIEEMSPRLQAKLLRVIEDGVIFRIGGRKAIHVDVRLIAASNKELLDFVEKGRFRQDLYYRLNVIRIDVPPLRERKEDIPVLVDYFLQSITAEKRLEPVEIHESAMEVLLSYPWPGNVRELRNLVEKLCILHPGRLITGELLTKILMEYGGSRASEITTAQKTLAQIRAEAEREAILKKLMATNWDYIRTAKELGISRATLFNKLREYNITRPSRKESGPSS